MGPNLVKTQYIGRKPNDKCRLALFINFITLLWIVPASLKNNFALFRCFFNNKYITHFFHI